MTTPRKTAAPRKPAAKKVTAKAAPKPEPVLSEAQADAPTSGTAPAATVPDEVADAVPAPLHERVTAALKAHGLDAVTIRYHGEKFVFPATLDDIDGDSLELLTKEETTRAVMALPLLLDPEQPGYGFPTSVLGLEQWALFKSLRPRRPQYIELFETWREKALAGLTAGE